LHSVLDCNEKAVQTCPPDLGCANGACIAACAAADANHSSIGCDYYSAHPPEWRTQAFPDTSYCFAAFVVNTWNAPVTIALERGGQPIGNVADYARIPTGTGPATTYAPLPNGQLPPGQIAIVFLSDYGDNHPNGSPHVHCPQGVTPALTADYGGIFSTGRGAAFHITTSAPVISYDIYPYGGADAAYTSATLLLPTAAWGTNFVVANTGNLGPATQLVAQEDGTQVTIKPSVDLQGGNGVPGSPMGVPITYALAKGEMLQFEQTWTGQLIDLTGSIVQSNKPIGLWGSAACFDKPDFSLPCDSAHQQLPPVRTLGSEYVAVRYRNRFDTYDESMPWRIVATVDGTQLTYDPAAPQGAPATLDKGQFAEFSTSAPFVVKSQDTQHPFYVAEYMSSCGYLNGLIQASGCRGDPEFVNTLPAAQFQNGYVFYTDPTYPETNLVFIRQKTPTGFADVTLDCAGTLAGWQDVGSSGTYQYARIDLVRHNFQNQGNCSSGRHEAKSDGAFGITVWGWGTEETPGFNSQAVSYAYPAGASLKAVNGVIVVPK
jgi:hypothetical protein